MARSPVTIKLVIHVNSELLKQDPDTGLPNLANLTLSRKVGGTANVVFQSKSPTNFGQYKDFTRQQSYQIGAYKQMPNGGALEFLYKILSSFLSAELQ